MVTRRLWLDTMLRTAEPVLTALSENRLKTSLPTAFHPDRALYAPLEAFGRTLCGMAPWLDAQVSGDERETQFRYRALVRSCMANAVDPAGPDYMNFTEGYGQSLVDAAFLAHAVLRAPRTRIGRRGASGPERMFSWTTRWTEDVSAPFETGWRHRPPLVSWAGRLLA